MISGSHGRTGFGKFPPKTCQQEPCQSEQQDLLLSNFQDLHPQEVRVTWSGPEMDLCSASQQPHDGQRVQQGQSSHVQTEGDRYPRQPLPRLCHVPF